MTDEMAGSDPDVWTTTIDAPIYETENDKYEYTVEETPILNEAGDQTYATIYKDLDEYTHQIINYLPSELIKEDTVVIDFGLSVDIDVLTNDTNAGGTLAGVSIRNGTEEFDTTLINKVTTELDDSFSSEAVWKETLKEGEEQTVVSGDYGTAQIKGDTIRFTPNTMAMDSWQEIMYAVQLDNNGQHQYVYGMVTVVPATTIYYEDNSGAIHYQDGGYTTKELTEDELAALTKDTDGWTSHGKWKTVGTESSDVQDTDRPGEAEIKNVIDNVYGNDTHYTNCRTYSNGSSRYVRVSAVNTYQNGGTSPRATFTFKGTGFDLISLTSRETGAVTIRVYEGTNSSGTKILDHTVDTYYGYEYTPDADGNGNGAWQQNPDSTDVLYQIPILKEEMEKHGQYYVEVIPMYSDAYDMYDDKYYDIYFDAVRIYDPAKPHEDAYDKIGDAYRTDGENHPDYTEIRQILLNAENVGGEIPNGAVFVDGNGEVSDIKAYESFGPKNEVYLAPGQGISFYLWTDEKPDKVQLGAKLALGTDTKLAIATAVQEGDAGAENGGWNFYKVKDRNIRTSYDLYYEFTDNCEWQEVEGGYMKYRTQYPIVIANPPRYYEDGELTENKAVLSLTNLQWTGRTDAATGDVDNQPTDDSLKNQPVTAKVMTMAETGTSGAAGNGIRLMASAAPENITAAYYFINLSDESSEPGEGEEGQQPGGGEEGQQPGGGEEGQQPGEGEESQQPGGGEEDQQPGEGEKVQAAGNAENDQDGQNTQNDIKTQNKNNAASEQTNKDAVQTGDTTSAAGLTVLFAAMAVSAAAGLAALRFRRKHGE